jgi:adenylate cyclase
MAGTSLPSQLTRLMILGNLTGAVLTFMYFHFVDPLDRSGPAHEGANVWVFFVVSFGLIAVLGRTLSVRWSRPVVKIEGPIPPGPAGDEPRRRALLLPGYFALLTFAGWIVATLVWGLIWPLIAGEFTLQGTLRRVFGMAFVAAPVVAAIVFFGIERMWRDELPRLFPQGDLSAVQGPRLRVRARLVAIFLLMSLVPIVMLSVAALSRANAMLGTDARTAEAIIRNLFLVVAVLAAGGLVISVRLAGFVAGSVARPLRDVQEAMAEVGRGALDTRCAVISNDEIGEVAEGFNRMVAGLREREQIRETFGKYVSPEVRDEILAGRASLSGGLREVTILFADLRDFTPWVESTPAAEVVADLNAYFTEMDAAIRTQGGLVLQYIGDEIEAVFGAPIGNPDHADSAVRAALEMRSRLDAWNAARVAEGKVALRHGIGIHSGTVTAGNIGSSERLSYALVGDAVNLTSRIQALNKAFGTQILVSGVTKARLKNAQGAGGFNLRALPAVRVKGRSAEVEVFALE